MKSPVYMYMYFCSVRYVLLWLQNIYPIAQTLAIPYCAPLHSIILKPFTLPYLPFDPLWTRRISLFYLQESKVIYIKYLSFPFFPPFFPPCQDIPGPLVVYSAENPENILFLLVIIWHIAYNICDIILQFCTDWSEVFEQVARKNP